MTRRSFLPAGPLAAALLGTGLFSLMDALMKGASIAIGAYNAMLWRSMIGAAITGMLYLMTARRGPSRTALRFHMMRSATAAVMTVCFFWGLARLPLAEAIALSFIAPLIALHLARVLLHERLHRGAVLATLTGFSGVVVIVIARLRGNYDGDALAGAGAILFSATCYAYNLILQRQQAAHSDPLEVSFFQSFFILLLLGSAAPWLAVLPGPTMWMPLAISAVLAGISLFLLSWAYGRAETQYLLTIEYSAFLWAVLFGWLFFREPVPETTWAGAFLILAASWFAARAGRAAHPVPVEIG